MLNWYDEWLIEQAKQRLKPEWAEVYIWHRFGRNGSEPLTLYAISKLKGKPRLTIESIFLKASGMMAQVIEISHRASLQHVPPGEHALMEDDGKIHVRLTLERNGEAATVTDVTAQAALRKAS